MCTGNYVQINKIMNFGLKWQRLGTDDLSCFTTAGMICTAAKLIKLDMLHSILEHVISSRYLNIFTLQMHGDAPASTGWWSFSSWFHLDDRKKKIHAIWPRLKSTCGGCYILHARHFNMNCGFGPLPNDPFSCVFSSETSKKSSGSRQNSETRKETFPKPRPRAVFPRGGGLRIHISAGMFTTSQNHTLFLLHVFSSCDRLSFPSAV